MSDKSGTVSPTQTSYPVRKTAYETTIRGTGAMPLYTARKGQQGARKRTYIRKREPCGRRIAFISYRIRQRRSRKQGKSGTGGKKQNRVVRNGERRDQWGKIPSPNPASGLQVRGWNSPIDPAGAGQRAVCPAITAAARRIGNVGNLNAGQSINNTELCS